MTVGAEAASYEEDLPDLAFSEEFYAKYQLKEVLGRGISSVVRRCVEKETGCEYAVKIIDVSNERHTEAERKTLKEATINEIEIMQRLAGHRYIIELHDSFEAPTYFFLVLELCSNGELFDYLTRVVTFSEKKTRLVMRQILEVVHYMHKKDIVHRDLKPENVLLDDSLNIKVSDMGFACHCAGMELTELCGTPGYLSPEILKCNMHLDLVTGYGKQVDLWACGVIMYTLLVGSPPFWHRKQMLMLRAIMSANYSFGTPEWDDISEYAKDLISKLLVVDPLGRLTAEQCLSHPFFSVTERQKVEFKATRKFKAAVILVRCTHRLRHYTAQQPATLEAVRENPYGVKTVRKVIDGCAFLIYSHWVKRGEDQNRAALFENVPKTEVRHSLSLRARQKAAQTAPSPTPTPTNSGTPIQAL